MDATEGPVTVYVALESPAGRRWVSAGTTLHTLPGDLPMAVVPEREDVADGVVLRVWTVRDPVSPDALERMRDRGEGPGLAPLLRLKVEP